MGRIGRRMPCPRVTRPPIARPGARGRGSGRQRADARRRRHRPVVRLEDALVAAHHRHAAHRLRRAQRHLPAGPVREGGVGFPVPRDGGRPEPTPGHRAKAPRIEPERPGTPARALASRVVPRAVVDLLDPAHALRRRGNRADGGYPRGIRVRVKPGPGAIQPGNSIRDAGARLSELVAVARRGERVSITRHGQPTAELVRCDRRGGIDFDKLEAARRRLGIEGDGEGWPGNSTTLPAVEACLGSTKRCRTDNARSARQACSRSWSAEALDRVCREQADAATLCRHLRFAGVRIVTLAEGVCDELHVRRKGMMNAQFRKEFAAKTHRGRGRVEVGRSGGGVCCRHAVGKPQDAAGELVRGERNSDGVGAEIVRRVCREFAGSRPARDRAAWQRGRHPRPREEAPDRFRAARSCEARHGSATARSLLAGGCGTASASRRTRTPASGSCGSIRPGNGSSPTLPSLASRATG